MIRERIANWLTGGELDRLRSKLEWTEVSQKILAAENVGLRDSLDIAQHYRRAITDIYRGTKDVKHGTAQKVARMCKEALE